MNHQPPASLPPGYFLAQELSSLPKDALFRQLAPCLQQFRTEDSVRRVCGQLAGKVDGVDYVNYWYTQEDGPMARRIAEIGREHGIDMWAGLRWQKQFRDLPVIPREYAGWGMDASGNVHPALWEERNHFLDLLNPEAVNWLCDQLEERYWPHVKGPVNGLFIPEARVPTFEFPFSREGLKPWTLYAYSPYVLGRWRAYCAEHDVRHEGQFVDRFPVPAPHMACGKPEAPSITLYGITMCADRSQNLYVPDNRPGFVAPFTRFADIAKGTPVWIAWETFLCELWHEAFLHTFAERANRLNADEPEWRGVCYFNNDVTILDYRDFQTCEARTGVSWGYWPQGRRMGVDLRRVLRDPEITCVISETVPSVREYWGYEENCLSRGIEIAAEEGRTLDYGFMLHYCCWEMDEVEEELRWQMFHKYLPPLFSMYSVPPILTEAGQHYDKQKAERFWQRLGKYKRAVRRHYAAGA